MEMIGEVDKRSLVEVMRVDDWLEWENVMRGSGNEGKSWRETLGQGRIFK